MRLVIVSTLFSLATFAADTVPTAQPSERLLTETELLKFKLAATQREKLELEYKIAAYRKELEPIAADEEATATAACKSIGIPPERIKTECRISDKDGAGKPMPAKVWWEKAIESKITLTPAPEKK